MGYFCYMTKAGYELQAKLFADGGDFEITRVMVGSGRHPEGADPSAFADLAAPVAQATSTKPLRRGCEVDLIVEYRSDLNGGVEQPFQITEFGVFALGADGQEALILYGDLSDYPETAVPAQYGGCVCRYPVNITIGPDAHAVLGYPAGAWMTAGDVAEYCEAEMLPRMLDAAGRLIAAHNADPEAHPALRGALAGLEAKISALDLRYNTDVSGNPFTVTFDSLEGLAVEGVWNTPQRRIEF